MTPQELQLLGGAVIGWIVQQFTRAPKNIPQWVSYAAIGVAGVLVYIWITPGVEAAFAENWRAAAAGLVTFLFQIRGQASTTSDAKIASATNTK